MNVNPVAFRTIRELAGLSQAELARRTGISQGHISQIESGQKHPRPPTVRRFATALGVPLASLLCSEPHGSEQHENEPHGRRPSEPLV